MSCFSDSKGREWGLALDFGLLRTLKKMAQVDFGDPEQFGRVWAELLFDDEKALKVLWRCVETQATDAGVSETQFLEAMNGEVLENALDALGEAVVNFTRPQRRGIVQAAMVQINEKLAAVIARTQTEVENLTMEAVERAAAAIDNKQSGK